MELEVAARTDVGCQRTNNEDSFGYWSSAEQTPADACVAVIADGMGGHQAGEQASRIAVDTIIQTFRDTVTAGNIPELQPQALLMSALDKAHHAIRDQAERNPEFNGMGTTCTAAAIIGGWLYFVHVGDARLYLIRSDEIQRLTRDHSYTGRLVESGLLSAEDAERHPRRHILTAALGIGDEVQADSSEKPVQLRNSEVLVFCTDGLWGLVSDAEIQAAVIGNSAESACQELVALARERGGPDNITVQILRAVGE